MYNSFPCRRQIVYCTQRATYYPSYSQPHPKAPNPIYNNRGCYLICRRTDHRALKLCNKKGRISCRSRRSLTSFSSCLILPGFSFYISTAIYVPLIIHNIVGRFQALSFSLEKYLPANIVCRGANWVGSEVILLISDCKVARPWKIQNAHFQEVFRRLHDNKIEA